MAIQFYTHDDCLDHNPGAGHPENPQRLSRILNGLAESSVNQSLTLAEAPLGVDDQVLLAHDAAHLDNVKATAPAEGEAALDADTRMSPGSLNAALRAVGAACEGVDLLMSGKTNDVFCATRPPGHHATPHHAMGFCLFNQVAIAAIHANQQFGLDRVIIMDFDVHHGNGTQELLWGERRTLTITSQQMPLWPGTGRADETGAYDNVINIALPPQSDGAHMRQVYETQVFPKLRAFKPELILISAGFDAHRDDPLAELNWDTDDFAWLAQEICAIAATICQGRVVSVLEGGYDLTALAASAKAHIEQLCEAAK